jgi:excinuclease ABC subunit B
MEITDRFRVVAPFSPAGDQALATARVAEALGAGVPHQTILGVTGSGKTYVMAKVIEAVNRPALVISHNKTLTAQLFHELKQFFPDNAVEYFVSYYDYYQPEAYIPATGTYIEKDSSINEEIDRLRHRATAALFSRRDCVVVASVSCIYGLGSPEAYTQLSVHLEQGQEIGRDAVISGLVDVQYQRNDVALSRGRFRARGDILEIFPISADTALRLEFFGDTIESIREFDPVTGAALRDLPMVSVFPAQHYVTLPEQRQNAFAAIEAELDERVRHFKELGRAIEAQRIWERTNYDLEMMREIGYCKGIENYSRPLSGRPPGSPPETLLHYLARDAIVFLDESHVTLPQVQGMYRGDRARKEALVEYGFRLPSAFDNRPLKFEEFDRLPHQKVYISATPAEPERERSAGHVTELVVRPTGLVDPAIEVRPVGNQVDDLIGQANRRAAVDERVMVTTLTKLMAEDLTAYLNDAGLRVRYMHSEITTLERTEIIRDFRLGKFDVLVGINLLREGLDIPECSLVAVLDADKEGFLRSTTSLIQTCGRAARNVNGRVILYADIVTESIAAALAECDRRRAIQTEYNRVHGITPRSVVRAVPESMLATASAKEAPGAGGGGRRAGRDREPDLDLGPGPGLDHAYAGSPVELPIVIARLRDRIGQAIAEERYEDAIPLRDRVYDLERELERIAEGAPPRERSERASGTDLESRRPEAAPAAGPASPGLADDPARRTGERPRPRTGAGRSGPRARTRRSRR